MRHKIVIGLTGSIGAGKSTIASFFNKCGATIFDADLCVRDLLRSNAAVKTFFVKNYPQTIHAGRVSRKRVGALIFSNKKARDKVEALLHKKVKEAARAFIKTTRYKIVILEVPLLFETGMEQLCDVTIVAVASPIKRKERVLKRRRMTEAHYKTISRRQMSDKEKVKYADVVFDTSISRNKTKKDVIDFYKDLKNA